MSDTHAEPKLRRSISGVRGTESTLTGDDVERYTRAYGTYLRDASGANTIVVGRDTRPTSMAYRDRVVEALLSGGWDVIDLGVVPTPTVQLAIHRLDVAGGAMVTASHNPIAYNGIKFLQNVEGHGMFLREDQVKQVFAIHDAGCFDSRRRGECRPIADLAAEFDDPPYTTEYLSRTRNLLRVDNAVILDYHLHRVIAAMGKDLDTIRARNFRVAMDGCGGAGIPIDYVLLDYLYADVMAVNDTQGVFSRGIEPTPANLADLCLRMQREALPFDVGFVTDCDNDRCVLIARDADTGEYAPLEEDYTFAIAVDQVLGTLSEGRTVVTNWSTSQMVKDICSAHHANLRRVPTGEVYTASDAKHFHAAIAGEGSCAGVIDPRVGMGRDVLVAIWHVLAALAHKREDLTTITRRYPRHIKTNRDQATSLSPEGMRVIVGRLQVFYAGKPELAFLSREDGLIVAFKDHSRLQIRSSNTEPLLRVRSSSPEPGKSTALAEEAIRQIEELARELSQMESSTKWSKR